MNLHERLDVAFGLVSEQIEGLYTTEKLMNTFQPHVNDAYWPADPMASAVEDLSGPAGEPTEKEVPDKHNPRTPGGELVAWSAKAANNQGKIWSADDPNFQEQRGRGNAWTIEDITIAMLPIFRTEANKIVTRHQISARVDPDDVVQEMMLYMLDNMFAKAPPTGEMPGPWIDQGRSPFIEYVKQRVGAKPFSRKHVRPDEVVGGYVHNKIQKGEMFGAGPVYPAAHPREVRGKEISLTSPPKGAEGGKTPAELIGPGAGGGLEPTGGQGSYLRSRLTMWGLDPHVRGKMEKIIQKQEKGERLTRGEERILNQWQEVEGRKEEFEENTLKLEVGKNFNQVQKYFQSMGQPALYYLRKGYDKSKKNRAAVKARVDMSPERKEEVLNHFNGMMSRYEQVIEKIQLDKLVLDAGDLTVLGNVINAVKEFTPIEKIIAELSFAIDKVDSARPELERGPPIQHPVTGEIIGYEPPAAWKASVSVHEPKVQAAGKFARGYTGVGGELRSSTHIADVINTTPEFYNTFLQIRSNKTTDPDTGRTATQSLLSWVSIDKGPDLASLEHIMKREGKMLVTTKQAISKIRTIAFKKLEPYLQSLGKQVFESTSEMDELSLFKCLEKLTRIICLARLEDVIGDTARSMFYPMQDCSSRCE